MQSRRPSPIEEKPRSSLAISAITRLPPLTIGRRLVRNLIIWLSRLVVAVCTRTQTHGFENIPPGGPMLVVSNHLGDADFIVGIARSPVMIDALAKAELYDFPVIGRLLEAYGVIWVRRGQPDRRALRAVLGGLREGRMIAIAPEARESLTGALEEGTHGAAYLALKAGVPLLPVTFTGTENAHIYDNLKKLRRTEVTMTAGKPFRLDDLGFSREAIEEATQRIMAVLAAQLPEHYRGVYRKTVGYSEVGETSREELDGG